MSDLSFEVQDVNLGGMVIQADRRFVQFRQGMRINRRATLEAGRPVFIPQTLFCVRHPGERDETVVEATDFHKMTHPRQWAAFEQGQAADAVGTPLAILFPGEPHICEHLRGLHIRTVEMLAELSEEGMRRIGMGAREWKGKAQKFIDAATSSAPLRQVEAQLEESRVEIDALKAQLQMVIENTRKAAEEDTPRRRRRAAEPEFEGDSA
jgi:hypothetical protein